MSINFHESLSREPGQIVGPNRSFGLVMAVAFLAVGVLGFLGGSTRWYLWLFASLGFAGIAWLRPTLLSQLNRAWAQLSIAMHKIVTPLLLGLVFLLIVTPLALLMRLSGQRPIGLEFRSDATSYWTKRDKSHPGPMANQY
jgi:fermentation-respiration switch protein FrsA (DUF1100 family)